MPNLDDFDSFKPDDKPFEVPFEMLSPFRYSLDPPDPPHSPNSFHSWTYESCNKVPELEGVYATRTSDSDGKDGKEMEYAVFKNAGKGFRDMELRPMTIKELQDSGAITQFLDDFKNFHNKVLGNNKLSGVLKVICADKVLRVDCNGKDLGDKSRLKISRLSARDRAVRKNCAAQILKKVDAMLKRHDCVPREHKPKKNLNLDRTSR